jgi:IS5 family transposase
VDAAYGLIHRMQATTGKVSNDSMSQALLHGDEAKAHGDRGHVDNTRGPDRVGGDDDVSQRWFVAFKRKQGCDTTPEQQRLNRVPSGLRSAVAHPSRVLKRQFGHAKARYRRLFKNERFCSAIWPWWISVLPDASTAQPDEP